MSLDDKVTHHKLESGLIACQEGKLISCKSNVYEFIRDLAV